MWGPISICGSRPPCFFLSCCLLFHRFVCRGVGGSDSWFPPVLLCFLLPRLLWLHWGLCSVSAALLCWKIWQPLVLCPSHSSWLVSPFVQRLGCLPCTWCRPGQPVCGPPCWCGPSRLFFFPPQVNVGEKFDFSDPTGSVCTLVDFFCHQVEASVEFRSAVWSAPRGFWLCLPGWLELHPWRFELDIFPSWLSCGHPYKAPCAPTLCGTWAL